MQAGSPLLAIFFLSLNIFSNIFFSILHLKEKFFWNYPFQYVAGGWEDTPEGHMCPRQLGNRRHLQLGISGK